MKLVSDENNRAPFGAEFSEKFKKNFYLLRSQHRRGLIENQDACIAKQKFQNFDALLMADGDAIDVFEPRNLQVGTGDLFKSFSSRVPINDTGVRGLGTQNNIVQRCQGAR